MKFIYKPNRRLFYEHIERVYGNTAAYAEKMKITRQAISFFVHKKSVNVDTLLKFANSLDLTINQFLDLFFVIESK